MTENNQQESSNEYNTAIKDILLAIQFAKSYSIQKMVIVGGKEAYKITKELKQNKVSVILNRVNDLPDNVDDDVDYVYDFYYFYDELPKGII